MSLAIFLLSTLITKRRQIVRADLQIRVEPIRGKPFRGDKISGYLFPNYSLAELELILELQLTDTGHQTLEGFFYRFGISCFYAPAMLTVIAEVSTIFDDYGRTKVTTFLGIVQNYHGYTEFQPSSRILGENDLPMEEEGLPEFQSQRMPTTLAGWIMLTVQTYRRTVTNYYSSRSELEKLS